MLFIKFYRTNLYINRNTIFFFGNEKKLNYWTDWLGVGNYTIAGPVLAEDIYPLVAPPV